MSIVYLDTHVLVWLYAGMLDKFTAEGQQMMETHELRVSPMALLEIEYLNEKGVVTVTPDTLFAELAQTIGLAVCTIPFAMVSRAAFSLAWTRDPFDRLIVAQSRVNEEPLLSKDLLIRQNYLHAVW
ncbi:hypothetical protein RIE95_09975 [Acidithiobacillus thiooxidans]|uniref:type II toxin-antitoxin system VapC family toxin n=2 Tax=Acidithiobacillus TaxID=119977 RepID=UPI002855C355|nr:PIN domain-containing protein [Acidithiobacillus thiooxidans]MDR7927305.1 hypothetical protein [Acidithiobacillus thiooxidans]